MRRCVFAETYSGKASQSRNKMATKNAVDDTNWSYATMYHNRGWDYSGVEVFHMGQIGWNGVRITNKNLHVFLLVDALLVTTGTRESNEDELRYAGRVSPGWYYTFMDIKRYESFDPRIVFSGPINQGPDAHIWTYTLSPSLAFPGWVHLHLMRKHDALKYAILGQECHVREAPDRGIEVVQVDSKERILSRCTYRSDPSNAAQLSVVMVTRFALQRMTHKWRQRVRLRAWIRQQNTLDTARDLNCTIAEFL